MKTLFIFRHGETDWNREERMQGRRDIPLNDIGRTQALKLREFFEQNPVEVFLTSDLARAHETAMIARGESASPIILEPRLRETDLGDAEGLTHFEFLNKYGSEVLESWLRFPEDPDAQLPNGESKGAHRARVFQAIEEYLISSVHSRVAVSTHGGSMRRFIHHLRHELTEPLRIANCAVFRATFSHVDQSRIWKLEIKPVF